jgi:hypothetical protein
LVGEVGFVGFDLDEVEWVVFYFHLNGDLGLSLPFERFQKTKVELWVVIGS